MSDYNTQALNNYQAEVDMIQEKEDLLEMIVKSEYIDIEEGTGFVEDYIEELIPLMPLNIARYIASASEGFGGKNNREACEAVGQMLMDWMVTRAYEKAEESLEIRKGL